MFMPYLHRIQILKSLTFDEVESFVNASISKFISQASGFSQKHTPSLRNVGDGVYELIYISEAKYELSAAIKEKVDTAAKEVQQQMDRREAIIERARLMEVAKGHQGGAGVPHSPSKIKG